jgi:hypothetical protein
MKKYCARIAILLAASLAARACGVCRDRWSVCSVKRVMLVAPQRRLPHRKRRCRAFRFENFTTANGLPDNHVYAVLVDGDRIWAGTDNGLASTKTAWKTYTTKDGLAHRAVLSLALDKRTGDVWAGTMGGLSRISGGRIDSFTQLNSGLSNDVVYGVSVEGENVWVATAAGGCRLNTAHRPVDALQRAQHADDRDLGLWRLGHAHQGLLRGVGQRRAGVRSEDRALGQVRRSGRRKRDCALQGSGADPRDCHVGQLCGQYPLGGHVLRRTAATTAATGTTF